MTEYLFAPDVTETDAATVTPLGVIRRHCPRDDCDWHIDEPPAPASAVGRWDPKKQQFEGTPAIRHRATRAEAAVKVHAATHENRHWQEVAQFYNRTIANMGAPYRFEAHPTKPTLRLGEIGPFPAYPPPGWFEFRFRSPLPLTIHVGTDR